MQPKETRTAVMHFKKTSSFTPDYYADRMIKWRWIIYPWAAAEDISEFIKEIEPRPETTREIKDILARDHGVRIPSRVLEDILAMDQT